MMTLLHVFFWNKTWRRQSLSR